MARRGWNGRRKLRRESMRPKALTGRAYRGITPRTTYHETLCAWYAVPLYLRRRAKPPKFAAWMRRLLPCSGRLPEPGYDHYTLALYALWKWQRQMEAELWGMQGPNVAAATLPA